MQTTEALFHLETLLGPAGWRTEAADIAPHLTDSRGTYTGRCLGLALPNSTEQVVEVVKLCAAAGLPIVPQGGNTGRCGGATPDKSGTALLLNLARMNRVRTVDAANDSMTVEAGCILQTVQEAALAHDRFFPLSLGAEGSCQIGGNLASNAGGVNVLRYGNARELTLGLEAVLPDGRVWNGLRSLRKDNTGYDLKQLLIGSEGTLGLITAAALRLFPKPLSHATALCALTDLSAGTDLLALLYRYGGELLSSLELMPKIALEWAVRHSADIRSPFPTLPDWSVLAEFSSTRPGSGTSDAMEEALSEALTKGLIADAVLAQTDTQRAELWRLREVIVDAQAQEGASFKHDIAVPVSQIPTFIRRANQKVEKICPGIQPYPFGHLGDGNIHYNLSQPTGMDPAAYKTHKDQIAETVHDLVHAMQGSISAEHGVGQAKRDILPRYKSPVELEMMRAVKRAFDPQNIMNPGKILS